MAPRFARSGMHEPYTHTETEACCMRRFRDLGDDRSMEASYQQMQAEERRSLKLARADDRRAEAEEAARAAAKAARRKLA